MHLNNGLDIPPRNRDILETSILEILRTYNASMWLAGPGAGEGNYVDSLGFTPAATADSLVGYADDASVMGRAENWIINSEFVGADAVTPPSIWTGFTTTLGVVFSYAGGGEDEFGRYIDVRVLGTASGAAFPVLHAVPVFSTITIKPGEIMSVGGFHQVVAGSTAGMLVICPRVQALTGAGGYVEEIAAIPTLPTSERTYASGSRVVAGATAVHARPCYQFNVTNGATVDCTVRIWKIQANRGRLNPYTPTFGTMITKPADTIPAYQATTGFKPTLVGGVKCYTHHAHDMPNGAWSLIAATATGSNAYEDYGNSIKIQGTSAAVQHYIQQSSGRLAPDNSIVYTTVLAKPIAGSAFGRLQASRKNGSSPYCNVNLDSGEVESTSGLIGFSVKKEKYGFTRINMWFNVLTGATNVNALFMLNGSAAIDSSDTEVEIVGLCSADAPGIFQIDPPVTTIQEQYANDSPYSWKFDGVDDCLVVAKPTITSSGNSFRIIAFKMPPVADATANILVSSTGATVQRGMQVGTGSGGFNIQASLVDDAGLAASPAAITGRQADERIVHTTTYNTVTGSFNRARGDKTAPATTSSASLLGAMTILYERVGCHAPNNVNANFAAEQIYGFISGMGNPSAGELTAMENFLAGHAGFTPLP